ncbi:hypothetical protein BDV36DRAFT_289585 [Aspergillus pseudocaelatus]|uniref:F-box domain-containing protein n=1 Tax=Aspergillus pseudocaelatus TaxID=1825620 RepID=A0ABQ6VZV9_9EURO|nr:hypothetical protein BDV36DRAFT_289585 [Aspergillus pseudocaelatus]
MHGFLSLPPELIFQVYCSLDSIGDAYFLSQACKQTYYIFSRPQSHPKIFEAIIVGSYNLANPHLAPTQAWLEAQFGPGSLWQPTEASLPEDLTDEETLEFLLDVGFPSVNLPRIGFNSIFLRRLVNEEQRFYGCTPDDLYIMLHPEERDKIPALSFCFGEISSQLFYDPLGGLYMNCDRGIVAYGLDTFARRVEVLMNPLDVLRKKFGDYDFAADYYSEFWDEVFNNLLVWGMYTWDY